jgi:hypothetical protein
MHKMRDGMDLPNRGITAGAASEMAPGKRTLTETLSVQRKGDGAAGDVDVHAAAAQGIAGPDGPLPHRDAIQQSFGSNHDLSEIRAHTDGTAQQASAEMGAAGYATGNHVAFAGTPDLHLAAHEAAHVVQQRAGVQLSGGVGAAGDAYERNADEVADRVVAGQSAADLLPSGQGGTGSQLQHKPAAPAAGHAAERAEDEADEHDLEALEADESEERTPANVTLAAGKPPGAVQKKAASGAPAPHANASRARPLTIQEATARYAPLVFLAPGETHRPSNASDYIRNSSLRWSHDSGRKDHEIAARGHVDEDRLGGGGYQHQVEGVFGGHHGDPIHSNDDARPKDGKGDGGNEGFFLDLDNSKHESKGPGTNAPVYYEAVNGRYITYWFFYAYNAGPAPGGVDNHEGDWERISVKLNRQNRATAVAYFQHTGHEEKRWRDVPKQGSHPLVFSAKGSHASYDSPGAKNLGVPFGLVKDHAGRGAQWKTWQHLQNARAQGWYGYGGAWGEVGNIKETTGPQGPSRFKPPAPDGW